MKKIHAILAASVMAASIMACGQEAVQSEPETSEVVDSVEDTDPVDNTETATEKAEETTKEEVKDATLAVPKVKDGVKKEDQSGPVAHFEWDAVDGADGYELTVKNKFVEETEFVEDSASYDTTDNFYDIGAPGDFDFIIKVRAYKGEGANRVYSDWSSEAKGANY